MTTTTESPSRNYIIYDGECIYCNNYVKFVSLRETLGKVDLVDARSGDPRVQAAKDLGIDLNEGMVASIDGEIYHGAKAVNILAQLSSDSKFFNKLNRAVFSNRLMASFLYPFLKAGRRATLFIRGSRLIDQ
ncbi:DCC1-like thiol-disulfide oxidoreductase family protein [Hoeflea sp. YIM 152468]|uniref:DCC1-like thiol-disulfide oxidoreductase family protein n=1 Tax=Hoeflea sp. YIM 152468 TaxID=3031759 RepID=UPI0023DACB8E|nr:DCC1-like thiol-disulfide oxidoreductase family protein [Hoeflea sp. YIM 152468]MDF1610274.1 DCC1-like thiol-disulfide oxidoreductase family protein [Hoeflea sp. YIM 152468]